MQAGEDEQQIADARVVSHKAAARVLPTRQPAARRAILGLTDPLAAAGVSAGATDSLQPDLHLTVDRSGVGE